MALVGDLVVNLGVNSRNFQSGLGAAKGTLRGFSSGVTSSLGSVTGFAAGLAGTAAAALGIGSAIGAVSEGFQSALNMEQTEVAFGVLFGNSETAKAVLSDLAKFAASTPFELPELVDAGRSLAAFGVGAGDITPTLRMIGDVAAGIGQPIGEIAEIYGKARVQGRLFAEDVNQLTGRGIPIIQELARQFGVNESEVRKLVESGKIGFPQVEKAFQNMTSEGGKFSGMMEKQSQTTAGMLSTLKDAVGTSLREVATVFLTSFDFKGLVARATQWATQFGEIVTFAIRNASDLWTLGMTDMSLAVISVLGPIATPLIAIWDGSIAAFANFASYVKGGLTEIGNVASALGAGIKAAFTAAFDMRDPLTAFTDAFTEEFAKQKDAAVEGNPMSAFMDAFQKSSKETGGFFDDMQTGLIEDRDRILDNIANRELKFSEQQAAEAAAAAGLTESGATTATTTPDSKKKMELAAGAERGSKEALDHILKAGSRGKDPAIKIAENQLKEQRLQTTALQTIANNPPAFVVGEI